MKFVSGSELSETIRDILTGWPSDMAVAFWGDGAIERLAIPFEASGSRVACDARSGSCNPKAISALLGRNVAIVDVPGLHAKVYIGKKGVVISSANASANGLGEEGDEVIDGLEAGYLTERPEDIKTARQWFEVVYKQGTPVTKADLSELRTLWRERQAHRPLRRRRRSLLEVLLNEPKLLRNRHLKVSIGTDETLPATVEGEYKRTQYYNRLEYEQQRPYPFFWDTPREWKARTGDLILTFLGDERGKEIECEGVWRVQAVMESGLIPVEAVRNPLRLQLPLTDKRKLAKRVQTLVDSGDLEMNRPLISIESFAETLANKS